MNKPGEKIQKNLGRSLPRGKGKEVEFRSKKQKNELHILKMSQEWDLRRQKRRLDRQKWVEERRNQKLPIWQRVGNLRVQVNEEILDEAGNELVNKKQQIENLNETVQTRDPHDGKVKEKSLELRAEDMPSAFRVHSSRLPESTTQGTGFSANQKSEPEIRFIKIEQARTMEKPLLYNMDILKTSKTAAQITEHVPSTAFKNSSESPSRQEEEHHESKTTTEKGSEGPRTGEITSVTIQKLLRMEGCRDVSINGGEGKPERKRKLERIDVDAEDVREVPTLLRVDKPTTLENIERENGPITISSSTNNSVVMKPTLAGMDKTANGKGAEAMPQIKQCYSLLDRRDETPNVNFFATKKSSSNSTSVPVSVAITMTTAPSEAKGQAPSVPVDPKCVVYLSKAPAPAPLPGTPNHPRPGYLVPVFKASTRETAYAFLPAGSQRPHIVGDKSGKEGRTPNRINGFSNGGCATTSHQVAHSYPSPRSTTGLKEVHTGCVSSTGKFVSCSQTPHELYSHAVQNTRVHSCYEPASTAVTLNLSRTDPISTNGGLPSGISKNHGANFLYIDKQPQKTTTSKKVGPPRPESAPSGSAALLAQEIKGTQTAQDKLHYPAFVRTTEVAANQTAINTQEAIFNPMSLYVRPKLVPREVVAVNHGAEPSPPLVEYIKTDAICEKELTKWDAKNVANFIAATDCADKAELFLEQEIDGKALLSLSPEMLMKGLNLKLGPSVKLYNHIANLRAALLL